MPFVESVSVESCVGMGWRRIARTQSSMPLYSDEWLAGHGGSYNVNEGLFMLLSYTFRVLSHELLFPS